MSRHTPLQIDDAVLACLEPRVLAQHFDDPRGGRASLQFLVDQCLILVRSAIHSGLTGGHSLARHHHRLDILQEVIGGPGAGGGSDYNPSRAAIDSDYGPCCKRRRLESKPPPQKKNSLTHHPGSPNSWL